MFDKYNQNINIKPACSGMLQKSHPKSVFEWCHIESRYRKDVVENNPRVLQIMVFGDRNMIVEILPLDVYMDLIKE